MGWIILLGFLVLLFGGLIYFGKVPRGAWELTAASLLLGVAGYAWQGQPGMVGVSITPDETPASFDPQTIESRKNLSEQFGTASQWLVFSDSLVRRGKYGLAANYLRNGVKEHPKDPDLWVGLGNALIGHADGVITPAAQFAFQNAADIAPEHPAPPFFMGLAYAQSGKIDQARAIWNALLERSPAEAPWRKDLESRLQTLEQMQSSFPAQPGNSAPVN